MTRITGVELCQRRTAANISRDELASALGRHVDELATWERSTSRLPREVSDYAVWAMANLEHHRAFQAAGITLCAWVQAHASANPPDETAREKLLAEIEEHSRDCEACKRFNAFGATLPPLPPRPMPGYLRALAFLYEHGRRVPHWLRPAVIGAALVGMLTIARALLFLVLGRAQLNVALLGTVLAATALGAYGGAIGGVAYAVSHKWARRLGELGPYVLGLICAYTYVVGLALPLTLLGYTDVLKTGIDWVIVVIIGGVFGITLGHSMFRNELGVGSGA